MTNGKYTRGKGRASAIFATKKYREATGDLIGTMNFKTESDPTDGRNHSKMVTANGCVLRLWPVVLRRGTRRARGWIVKFGEKKWNGIVEVLSEAPISRAFRRGTIAITCGR